MVLPAAPQTAAPITPLQQRAVEITVANAFLEALEERFGAEAAASVFHDAVERLAAASASVFRERFPEPTLSDLWSVWAVLGGEGRLDLHLDELTDRRLVFHVDRCAYAEMYRSRHMERAGIAFSCRRDAPFARALVPGVHVEQSPSILEGSPRCEFTYTLEDE